MIGEEGLIAFCQFLENDDIRGGVGDHVVLIEIPGGLMWRELREEAFGEGTVEGEGNAGAFLGPNLKCLFWVGLGGKVEVLAGDGFEGEDVSSGDAVLFGD